MNYWSLSSVVLLFALLAFVVGAILMLSVVTKCDDQLENDRANATRANLILLVSVTLALLVLATQRLELGEAVKHLMQ